MPLRLNDEQCLLWIKDPSISPYENIYKLKSGEKKDRKNILNDESLKNPKSFLNKVRRKCFYNSALRQKIVDQIKEYERNRTLRLYTLNDKRSDTNEYMSVPFTEEECSRWVNNHLVNPRTNEKINMVSSAYIELIYTTLQYKMRLPSALDTEPTDKYDKTFYILINNIIKDVKFRLEYMKNNDKYFLNHNIESFDKKLKIESLASPGNKKKSKNTFSISSSSSPKKNLDIAERKLLRDMKLENIEEKKLVAEYQYKKGFLTKKDANKTIFDSFKAFLIELQNEVMTGNQLINNILKDATDNTKSRITGPINSYLQKKKYSGSTIKNFLHNNKLDTIEGVISKFINNIYIQLIEPTIVLPLDMDISCLSNYNKLVHFKDSKIIKQITTELVAFIKNYSFVGDYKIKKYFINLVEDKIPREFIDKRLKIYLKVTSDYKNLYYTLLFKTLFYTSMLSTGKDRYVLRLPEGMGLLIGKELTKKIIELNDENFVNVDDRVITDDNPLNGFTYEECKNWVILPIINPRTFKPILIDSPIYNRLLCMSYQYDTYLIPRMITQRGYNILIALTNIIENILKTEVKLPQSREQLENYIMNAQKEFTKEKEKKGVVPNKIGLKWKNAGAKYPKGGVAIINDKLKDAIIKSVNSTNKLPFYVFFSEEDLEKFGITSITKNSYVEIDTYYIPIANSSRSSKIGLKWENIGAKQPKEGIEIINKKLTNALLKKKALLKETTDKLPSSIIFSEEDLVSFGITNAITKNNYIKITKYYVPVFEKSFSDFIIKPKSNVIIKNRNPKFSIYKYYTIADCLRWAHQPNRDPKNPDILLITDGEEYNAIFEQALLYDYNIQPINITPKGIKFMNSVLKTKFKLLNTTILLSITKHSKLLKNAFIDIKEINNRVCNAIQEIYDDDSNEEGKKYKKFKDKMIERCVLYNRKPGICIKELKDEIIINFPSVKINGNEHKINYYQDSALASLLIKYDISAKKQIYNKEIRDIFIHDFNKFYIYIYEIDDDLNEHKKDAIDAGGPKREFFTKLFEELFCDEEHLTRPFISPKNINGDIYCINPNFIPDEKFIKVINAYKKNHKYDIEFNTERDYEYIYFVIGKILCLTVYNELIGLPKQFSSYILAGLIYQANELNYYDILYFYLKDFESTIPYINMISNKGINDIEYADLSFNNLYVVSKSSGGSQNSSGVKITKENCIKFILQQSKHVVTKNFLVKEDVNSSKSMKKRYDSLFAGFSNEIRKFLYRKKVTIEQLSLLITNEQLTDAILEEFVSKIKVYMEIKYTSDSFSGNYTGDRMSDEEQKERCDNLKRYISNIITQRREGVSEKEHFDFIKNLLRFWSGLTYYDKTKTYQICYKYGVGINVNNLPNSHTCTYTLDIFGFPNEYNQEKIEEFMYNKFKLAVGEQEMELH